MVCLNLHQLLNTEFIISYLSSNKAGIIDRENEYTCFKSMRPFSRFFYIIEGETFFTFTCNDGTQKTIRAEKNDIVFLPDDIEYKSYWSKQLEIDYVSVEFCLKGKNHTPILLNEEITVIAKDSTKSLLPRFLEINKHWSNGLLGYKLKCKSLIFELLLEIAIENINMESPNSLFKGIIYIENHYLEDISVCELAKMSNMCETSFRKKFKEKMKMSPIEYKNYLRLKKSAELMKTGFYTVTEAAQAVCIDDIYYFSKLFKRQYKISPRQYILKTKKEENHSTFKG